MALAVESGAWERVGGSVYNMLGWVCVGLWSQYYPGGSGQGGGKCMPKIPWCHYSMPYKGAGSL